MAGGHLRFTQIPFTSRKTRSREGRVWLFSVAGTECAQLFIGGPAGFQILPPTMLADSNDARNNYWNRQTLGRTMAVMDWNRDLKPDLVCNHLDAPVAILENQTEGGNAVQFELVGVISERDAVAAELTVICGRDRWTSWVTGGDGFLCSNEPFLDVGIGPHDQIDEVWVRWPSGAHQRFSDIERNQRYLLTENEERAFILPTASTRRGIRFALQ